MSIKDCCKRKENLVLQESKNDLTIHICKVCNCKHYKLKADTGKLFGELKALGV